jgi:hypothetical protein
MEQDFQILVNTPTQLVILNPPDRFDWFIGLMTVLMTTLFLWMAWKSWQQRSRVWSLGILLVYSGISFIVWDINYVYSDQMILDQSTHTITRQLIRFHHLEGSDQIDTRSVVGVYMDFDRSRRRIVFALSNGSVWYPFGDGFGYKDNDYQVLALIQQRLAQP